MLKQLAALASIILGTLAADALADGGGVWTELIAGKGLSAWRKPLGEWTLGSNVVLDAANAKRLAWQPGMDAAINGPKGRSCNLLSTQEFGDVEVHVEFTLASRSNSGVYFMGRYELQVYDSYGVAKDEYPGIECGGLYPRWINNHNVEGHSPLVNASLPPGQWQIFDVIFHAPRFDAAGKKTRNATFVKVLHNGKLIHENVEVSGPTRAAFFNDEKPLGPIMLQGDHGPVAYRSVRLRPLPVEGTRN
jgi:hypothetical protein